MQLSNVRCVAGTTSNANTGQDTDKNFLFEDLPNESASLDQNDLDIQVDDIGESDADEVNYDDIRPGALNGMMALDYPAELKGVDNSLKMRISQEDTAEDEVICSFLPPECLFFDWRKEPEVLQSTRELFTGSSGPTFPKSDIKCPSDAFLKIWDNEILDLIVEETNLYAQRVIQMGQLKAQSRLKKWYPITRPELLVFLTVIMLQGLNRSASELSYWYSPILMPNFKKMMTYERYALIKRFLHFVSDSPPDKQRSDKQKLHKIQPVLDHLARKFAELYRPQQEIALDDSLLMWKGRLSFTQKMFAKGAEDIKSYEICDSNTGYLWSFKMSAGKEGYGPNSEKAGSAMLIVLDLLRPLFGKGHTLVMDNCYSSPLLTRYLKRNGVDSVGTLRVSRQFLPEVYRKINKNMSPGQLRSRYCEDLSVLLWRDSKVVSMISSYHKTDTSTITKFEPKVVVDYNKVMAKVDDKYKVFCFKFLMERNRGTVWYKTLFRRLLNVSILNSYVLYQQCREDNKLGDLAFRKELVLNLLAMCHLKLAPSVTYVIVKEKIPVDESDDNRPILIGNHFVESLPPGPRVRCVWCNMKGLDRRTTKRCDVCLVPLCLKDCFKEYHTIKKPVRIKLIPKSFESV